MHVVVSARKEHDHVVGVNIISAVEAAEPALRDGHYQEVVGKEEGDVCDVYGACGVRER